MTGELSATEVRGIVDQNYRPEPIAVPETIEKPVVETKEVEIKSEPAVKSKSSESEEKVSKVKPKVNYTPPSVVKELNPIKEEVVETREPTLDVVPIPKKSESLENSDNV